MRPISAFLAGLTLLVMSFALLPSRACAQNSEPSNPVGAPTASPQTAAPPQATSQNSSRTSSATSAAGANPGSTAQPASKKVWTNDDMGSVHSHDAISTFSATNAKAAKANPAANSQSAKNARQYRQQILTLQAKLPELDQQISQLQAGLNGDTVNETRRYGGVKIDDWHDQLVRLQKQREDIAVKIGSLQDEARHNGVPDSQIP
jgi:uncharacterized protein YukE